MNLVNIETARSLMGMPSEPQMGRMFGDKERREDKPDNLVGRAVNIIIDHMVDRLAFTGSVISRAMDNKPVVVSQELAAMKELVGQEIYPLSHNLKYDRVVEGMPQTVNTAYYESAYDLERMPKMSYLMLKLILAFGQNIDAHGFSKMVEDESTQDKLMTMLALANHKLVNGRTALLSQLEYYKRFQSIHLEIAGDKTGGINIMNFDPCFNDARAKMLSYQVDSQYGRAEYDQDGVGIERKNGMDSKKMAMIGNPKDLGDWIMHSARAIRTIVMEGDFEFEGIDFQSFIDRIPTSKQIGFEAVVAILANMIVAHKQSPDLTQQLVDKLGLDRYFSGKLYNRNDSRLEKWLNLKMGIDPEKWDNESFCHDLDQAEYDLYGTTNKYRNIEKEGEFRFQDFVPLIIKFLPIGFADLLKIIPQPAEREVIKPIIGGVGATKMARYNEGALLWDERGGNGGTWLKKLYLDSADIFDEMMIKGEKECWKEEELVIIREARKYLYDSSATGIAEEDVRYAEYLKYSATLRYNPENQRFEVPIGYKQVKGWQIPIFQAAAIQ